MVKQSKTFQEDVEPMDKPPPDPEPVNPDPMPMPVIVDPGLVYAGPSQVTCQGPVPQPGEPVQVDLQTPLGVAPQPGRLLDEAMIRQKPKV